MDGSPNRAPALPIVAPSSWADPSRHFREAIEHPWYRTLFNLYGAFYHATNDFFRAARFQPALMPVTCESISSPMGLGSDSVPVSVDLFGKPTYLADSMQFMLEYLLRQAGSGVYYVMPTFRGEDPDRRHLNQFFHAEAEIVGGLDDVMACVERYVISCSEALLDQQADLIEGVTGDVSHMASLCARYARERQLPRISFAEALARFGDEPGCFELRSFGPAITSSGERRVMEAMGGATWLTHLPAASVPFYQALAPDGVHALCADLLLGIGEVVGSGERHRGADDTLAACARHEVDPAPYRWYVEMKRAYPMRTAGFGLGLERYLMWVLQHDDIRDMHLISRLKGIQSSP